MLPPVISFCFDHFVVEDQIYARMNVRQQAHVKDE